MKKILVIEDDQRIREITQISLEMMTEWRVLTASCGLEGIRIAEEKRPDLILLDLMMPELDGEETMKKLYHNHRTKNIPILLLSAKNKMCQEWKEMGVKGFINKPFDALTLAECIANVLGWELE
jgi:CheY-like chemotaxis protein